MSAQPQNRRDIVVVLGMHRSGTSALAGVLARLGCALPQEIMPANDFNPKGYYESILTYNLNDEIFRSVNTAWDDWQAFPQDWYSTADMDAFMANGRRVLQKEFGNAPICVLKDPRVCRLMPFWKQVFEREGLHPTYLLIHRNPIEVANSLLHREGWPMATGFLLWLRHVLEAEAGSRGAARSFANYESLLTDWQSVVENFQTHTGLTLPRSGQETEDEVSAFLTSDLRHSAETAETLAAHPDANSWVKKTFDVMERWVREGENAADFETLDAIRLELDRITPMFGPIVQYLRAERAKDAIEMKKAEIQREAEQRHATEKYQELLTSSLEETHSLNEEIAQRDRDIAARDEEIHRLDKEAKEAKEALAALESSTKEAMEQREKEAKEVLAALENSTKEAIEQRDKEAKEALAALENSTKEAIEQRDKEAKEALAALENSTKETIEQRDKEAEEALAALENSTKEAIEERDNTIEKLKDSLARVEQSLVMVKQTARADFNRQRTNFEEELADVLQAHRSQSDIQTVHQQEKLAQLEAMRDRLRADLQHSTTALDRMKADRDRSDAERESLRDELNRYQARVHDLEHSTSWKITGPIRRVVRLLKRVG